MSKLKYCVSNNTNLYETLIRGGLTGLDMRPVSRYSYLDG